MKEEMVEGEMRGQLKSGNTQEGRGEHVDIYYTFSSV